MFILHGLLLRYEDLMTARGNRLARKMKGRGRCSPGAPWTIPSKTACGGLCPEVLTKTCLRDGHLCSVRVPGHRQTQGTCQIRPETGQDLGNRHDGGWDTRQRPRDCFSLLSGAQGRETRRSRDSGTSVAAHRSRSSSDNSTGYRNTREKPTALERA